MFKSSNNISHAITQMLKTSIEEKYQMSNTVGVKGWHNLLEANYGRPDPSAI
jgi:hypothetical protein